MGRRILFLGPQGSGKGTQAAMLSRLVGVPHISSGDMLRQAVAEGTEFGRRAEAVMGGRGPRTRRPGRGHDRRASRRRRRPVRLPARRISPHRCAGAGSRRCDGRRGRRYRRPARGEPRGAHGARSAPRRRSGARTRRPKPSSAGWHCTGRRRRRSPTTTRRSVCPWSASTAWVRSPRCSPELTAALAGGGS